MSVRIALVGDFDPAVTAHRAIPRALELACKAAARADVTWEWVPTDAIRAPERMAGSAGVWCVPASPYRSTDGALAAIRVARENGLPFLGTCGGFQHAVLEYARHVLGGADAEHAELAPGAARTVIAPLACSLVEKSNEVRFVPGTRIAAAYTRASSQEGYHCSYGLNPELAHALTAGPLRATAHDESGEVRAVELDGHPFFVATLFQPERAALEGVLPPLVAAFVRAVAGR
ncbi:MAG: CTP synthase [Candidatus Eisenbacteria bacterium]